MQYYGFVLV